MKQKRRYFVRAPQKFFGKVVSLFLQKLPKGEEEFEYHFCVVKRASALLRSGFGKCNKVMHCAYCGARFQDLYKEKRLPNGKRERTLLHQAEELHTKHEPSCNRVGDQQFRPEEVLPKPGQNVLRFKKYEHLFKFPLRVYADFECALETICETVGDKTTSYQKHVPKSFTIKFCFEIRQFRFKPICYTGKDAAKFLWGSCDRLPAKWSMPFQDPFRKIGRLGRLHNGKRKQSALPVEESLLRETGTYGNCLTTVTIQVITGAPCTLSATYRQGTLRRFPCSSITFRVTIRILS